MNWLAFVAIATFVDASRIYIDNYISDCYFKGRRSVSQKYFYGIAFTLFGLILLPLAIPNFASAPATTFLFFFLAGLLASFAGIPYYRALEIDESTNLGIFIQLAPILYLILGWLFLGETILPLQILAFLIIISAPLLIILTSRKRSRNLRLHAAFYAFLYVTITVIGNLMFIKENTAELNFFGEISFVFLGKGIGNFLIMMCRPKWRQRFHTVIKKSRRKVLRPLSCAFLASVLKDFNYLLALATAPSVALASVAADSSEPIVIFFLGIILTLLWPKFGREKLNRKSVAVHLIATVLVVVGIVLLQI